VLCVLGSGRRDPHGVIRMTSPRGATCRAGS